jgi:hypothetical protein
MTEAQNEVQRVVQLLEDEVRPFTPTEVEKALQRYDLDLNAQTLTKQVIEEGYRRTVESLGGLWRTLGVSPLCEAEEALREGGSLQAVCVNYKGKATVAMTIRHQHHPELEVTYPFPEYRGPGFTLQAQTGWVLLETYTRIYATRGRVFFTTSEAEKIEEALMEARALRPLLESMRIGGLEEAIEELATLRDGEARMAGEYLLARNENIFSLRRGGVFGELALDAALLTQREVALFFPGDVELSFRVEWPLEKRGSARGQ